MVKILTDVGYIEIEKLNAILGGQTMKTFSTTITYVLTDSNNGKSFSILNFPTNCTIKEIRLKSNYISGQRRTWTVFVNNPVGILPADTVIPYIGNWDSSPVGEYIYIDNEIVLITADDGTNLTVTRGLKGTTASYHDNNTALKIANNGLRLVIYKNSNRKLVDRVKELCNIMTWKGITSTNIASKDVMIKFNASILNVKKLDTLYINDGSSTERTSVENIDNSVVNNNFINTVFVTDPLFAHNAGIEIRKQCIYDIPIIYQGDSTLNGLLYIDEEIDNTLYPSGISVDIDILTQ